MNVKETKACNNPGQYKTRSSLRGGVGALSLSVNSGRLSPNARAANDGWRAAMSYRARNFSGRIAFPVMLAVMTVGIIERPTAWIFAAAWLASALVIEVIESRIHLRILKRRLWLNQKDKIAAGLSTAGTGMSRAILFVYYIADFHTGPTVLAVILFFGMSVHYLRLFHGSSVLFACMVGPSSFVLIVACLASLWILGGTVIATAVLITAIMMSSAQLFYAARALQKNLSTIRRSRRQAEEIAERAAQAARAKSEFLAVISHELRTPMNAMLGSAELLRRTKLEGEQAEHLGAVLDSGTMLMTLLNDLLDVSKIEAGAMKTEIIPVNIRQLVERMHLMWQARASDQGLVQSLEIADDVPPWIMTDPMRLQQVLFNLLSNALKFTREGEIRIRVSAHTGANGARTIKLSVADTGIGIPMDVAARLFPGSSGCSVNLWWLRW